MEASLVNDYPAAGALGLDCGTTNAVVALADGAGGWELIEFTKPHGSTAVFRFALCSGEDETARQGIASEAGCCEIAEYLQSPRGSRFVQSLKTVAASAHSTAR